jgi:hypothetical protein
VWGLDMKHNFMPVKNNHSNKNYSMLSTKDLNLVYETLLTSPGMNEIVKIDFKITRRNVLLLANVLDLGLTSKNEILRNGFLKIMDEETVGELRGIFSDILQKSGLTEMNKNINSLSLDI